jgi:hypothetical protein
VNFTVVPVVERVRSLVGLVLTRDQYQKC